MTTVTSAALAAAAPSLISALEAVQQFETDIGPDPTKWVVTVEPAKLKLLGALGLLIPGAANAEVSLLGNIITTKTSSWIADLKALEPAPAPVAA